jgi:DNA-binding NarL/FixJ family response regulator
MATRVLLADDHVLVRQGLRLILEQSDFEVAGEASDGLEAIRLSQKLRPDAAVLDLMMPCLNGIDAAREIKDAVPGIRMVLLTMRAGEDHVLEALRNGIGGYVLKSHTAQDLVQALRHVLRGGTYLSPGISAPRLPREREPLEGRAALTARERQVLQLLAEGKKTREAALLLGISTKTAESHRSRILQKLGVAGTAGLVRYALQNGLSEL